jgi:hypothetical protein
MSNDFTVWDYLSIGLSGIAVPVAVLVAGIAILRGLRRDHAPSR